MLEGGGGFGGGVALIDEGAIRDFLVFLAGIPVLLEVLYEPLRRWEGEKIDLPFLGVLWPIRGEWP